MYPNQPNPPSPPQPGSGIDYLNQIAPQQTKQRFSPRLKWIALILGSMLVVVIAAGIFASTRPSDSATAGAILAKTTALSEITEEAKGTIKNTRLSVVNANLQLYLTDASSRLTEVGVVAPKTSKDTPSPLGTIAEKIEDARLSGTYDRVYVRELLYQIETLVINMDQLYSQTSNGTLKTTLEELYASLVPLQEDLSEISESLR